MEEKPKFCEFCGSKIEGKIFCPKCGEKVGEKEEKKPQKVEIVKEKGTWSTGKLVIGIISMVLFIMIAFQSCAAGIGNAIEENNSVSGSTGFLCALLMLSGGIVTVATRNKKSDGGSVAAIILYSIGALSAFSDIGIFKDLVVWGSISIAFALVNFGSIFAKKAKK